MKELSIYQLNNLDNIIINLLTDKKTSKQRLLNNISLFIELKSSLKKVFKDSEINKSVLDAINNEPINIKEYIESLTDDESHELIIQINEMISKVKLIHNSPIL